MSVGVDRLRDLLARLTTASADARAMAADSVTDWTVSFADDEAALVSRILLWLASAELDEVATEAQLNALADLAEHDLVPADVLADVGRLPREKLHGSSIEHYGYLNSLRKTD